MNQTTISKFKTNLSAIHKMASVWVMSAAGMLGMVWFMIPPDQQVTILEHTPIPLWMAPILATGIGIVARLWPSKVITKHQALAKSDTDQDQVAS